MADLTEEEDKELKRTDERHADGVGIRRDFSVIHSKQLKKNHLFLGPARFVNVSAVFQVQSLRSGDLMCLVPSHSMTVITMLNCSEKGDILPSA